MTSKKIGTDYKTLAEVKAAQAERNEAVIDCVVVAGHIMNADEFEGRTIVARGGTDEHERRNKVGLRLKFGRSAALQLFRSAGLSGPDETPKVRDLLDGES